MKQDTQSFLQYIVGMTLKDAELEVQEKLVYESLRVVGEKDIITCEYQPLRLNLIKDESDVITDIYYG